MAEVVAMEEEDLKFEEEEAFGLQYAAESEKVKTQTLSYLSRDVLVPVALIIFFTAIAAILMRTQRENDEIYYR